MFDPCLTERRASTESAQGNFLLIRVMNVSASKSLESSLIIAILIIMIWRSISIEFLSFLWEKKSFIYFNFIVKFKMNYLFDSKKKRIIYYFMFLLFIILDIIKIINDNFIILKIGYIQLSRFFI